MSLKKILTSYLQRIISIHHPTVCPGGQNQKPSGEKGKEASSILKEVPHGGEQPVPRAPTGKQRAKAHVGVWNAIWHLLLLPGGEKVQVFSFSSHRTACTLSSSKNNTNRL